MSHDSVLHVYARQEQPLAEPTARAALDWALESPWGQPSRQSLELDRDEAIDLARALEALARRRDTIELRGDGFVVSIGSYRRRSSIAVRLERRRFDAAQVGQGLHRMVTLLEKPRFGWASADPDVADWYHRESLPLAPACLGDFVRWMHVLPPGWSHELDEQAVAAIPGVRFEPLPDGCARVTTFDDPYRFDEPEVRAHRREVSEALRRAAR